jgi:hypothetical protein
MNSLDAIAAFFSERGSENGCAQAPPSEKIASAPKAAPENLTMGSPLR